MLDVIAAFTAKEKKSSINSKFKGMIDSVFSSEINATSFYAVKPKEQIQQEAMSLRTRTIFDDAVKK